MFSKAQGSAARTMRSDAGPGTPSHLQSPSPPPVSPSSCLICFCSRSPVVAALYIIAPSYWHALAWSSLSRRLQKKSFLAFTFSHHPAATVPRAHPTPASLFAFLPRQPSPPAPLHPLHPRAANGTKWHRSRSSQQAQATSHLAHHRPPLEADKARDGRTHAQRSAQVA
jgi:hypothetical protein